MNIRSLFPSSSKTREAGGRKLGPEEAAKWASSTSTPTPHGHPIADRHTKPLPSTPTPQQEQEQAQALEAQSGWVTDIPSGRAVVPEPAGYEKPAPTYAIRGKTVEDAEDGQGNPVRSRNLVNMRPVGNMSSIPDERVSGHESVGGSWEAPDMPKTEHDPEAVRQAEQFTSPYPSEGVTPKGAPIHQHMMGQ